jgi:hypothetical protein
MKTKELYASKTEPVVSPPKGELGVEVLRTPWGTWFWDESDGVIRYVPRNIRRATVRIRLEPYYRNHPDPMIRLAYAMKHAANYDSARITADYPHPNAGRNSPLHRADKDAKAAALAAGMVNPKRKFGVRGPDPTSAIVKCATRKEAWESRLPGDVVMASYDEVNWFEDMPGGGLKR